MFVISLIIRVFLRFRYPVSLPGDVAHALGVKISNFLSFTEFMRQLTSPECHPTRLKKFMPRNEAEAAFKNASRTERFKQNTLCSYYFNEGWMEFILQFDNQARLRRIYLQHKDIDQDSGVEIPLRDRL